MKKGGKKKSWTWRALRGVLVSAVSVWLLYVIAMNAFLSTPLFEKVINQDPDSIAVHYGRGWSLWPGRIHARDLWIRGRDSNVEWVLRLDQVEFGVSLFALTKQRFDVSYAHGRGVSFRLRQRIDGSPPSPDDVTDLAPIPGLPAYSVRPPKVESPEVWSDADYHLWQPHLEDVIAEDVREVWIDHHRLEGLTRITGRFHLIPIRSVDIGPVHVAVHEGRALRGSSTLFENIDGSTATVRVAPFDPRTASGDDVVHAITLDLDTHGHCPDVSKLVPSGDVTIAGSADVNALVLHIDHGVIKEGSRAEIPMQPAVISKGDHHLTGHLTLSGDVRAADQGAPGNRLYARIETPRIDVQHGKGRAFLHAKRVVVTGDSGELDLTHPLTDLHVLATLPSVSLPEVRALASYLPPQTQLAFRGGRAEANVRAEAWMAEPRGTLQAKLRTADLDVYLPQLRMRGSPAVTVDASLHRDVAHGSVDVVAKQLAISYRDLEMSGQLHAKATIPAFPLAGPLAKRTLPSARAEIELTGASLIQERLDAKGLHVRGHAIASAELSNWNLARNTMAIDTANATLSGIEGGFRRGASDFRIERIALRGRASKLDGKAPSPSAVEAQLQIVNAEVPDLRVLHAIVPSLGSMLAIESGRAHLGADVAISGPEHDATGQVRLVLSHAGIRLHETRLVGDFDIKGQLRRYIPERHIDLTGSRIHMRNIAVTQATTETSHWSGDALFQEALVRLGGKPSFEGQFSLEARDANPLLAILLRDSMPKLFAGLTDMPHLFATTQFTIAPDHLVFRNVDARGGDLAIHGLYATHEKRLHGAFVVEKGAISAGIGLRDDGAHVHFFNLDDWLQNEKRSVAELLSGTE